MKSNRFKIENVVSSCIRYVKRPRHILQLSVLLVTVGLGIQFYLYVRQSTGQGPITIQRPPGVEGFLPIGALMGWKFFLQTGRWDSIHPAAMVIFGWAVVVSFAFRKGFCGWFCPIGTISEWCWRFGRYMFGRNYKLPAGIDIPLRALKYALLGFFLWAVSTMSIDQTAAFMNSPYYKLSDVKMLYFFTGLSMTAAGVLLILAIFSLLYKNFWCRYLCPYGAWLGLLAMFGPTRIRRSERFCTQCKGCDRVCPCHLPVSEKPSIKSPECIGCMSCVEACPQPQALVMGTMGIKQHFWTPHRAAIFVALLFVVTICIASFSGYWHGAVSDHEFRARLSSIEAPENTHPSISF